MKIEDLIKKAQSDESIRNAMIAYAESIEKKAASNANTQFNESVPVVQQANNQQASGTGITGTAQQPNMSQPVMVDQAPPTGGQPPIGSGGDVAVDPNAVQAEPSTPTDEAVYAAQSFLAPVFEAAAQGDVNAQNTIARAAGEIARGIAESAMSAGAVPAEQQIPEGVMPQATPEEQVANQIVPDVTPTPPATKEESGKNTKQDGEKKGGTKTESADQKDTAKTASFDIEVVSALIKLAKAGKI